jgi:hypothetical protein
VRFLPHAMNSVVVSERSGIAALAPAVSGLQQRVADTPGNVLPGVNGVVTAASRRFGETLVIENQKAGAGRQPARLKSPDTVAGSLTRHDARTGPVDPAVSSDVSLFAAALSAVRDTVSGTGSNGPAARGRSRRRD